MGRCGAAHTVFCSTGERFMLKNVIKKKVKSEEGQALVEFALVLPLLLLIICGMMDFGWLFYNQLNVDNCARETARAICTECRDDSKSTADILSDATNIVKSNIYNEDTLPEPGGVKVVYLDSQGNEIDDPNIAENVKVTVKINMPVWTFVLQTICQSDTRVVSSSATYKIESVVVTTTDDSP